MARLSGKVALVTGASREKGIGEATALRLAAEGAIVVVAARDTGLQSDNTPGSWRGLTSVANKIIAEGGTASASQCDVTDEDAVEALISDVLVRHSRLDIVINNAGSSETKSIRPLTDLPRDAWARTLDLNLNGTYLVTKVAGRQMIRQGAGGAIVNVGSLAGRQGFANFGGYCAAKFGVIGLTQQSALEFARYGIRVNCVCPGATDTAMLADIVTESAKRQNGDPDVIRRELSKTIPLRRIGTADELAAAIVFLAGPDASFVTGQTLNVDGGQRMD